MSDTPGHDTPPLTDAEVEARLLAALEAIDLKPITDAIAHSGELAGRTGSIGYADMSYTLLNSWRRIISGRDQLRKSSPNLPG